MSKDELPSIEDFNRDDNLPSIKDFITEEKAEELPSVEDYVEKKEEILTEATQTIEDADGNSFTEIKDIVPPCVPKPAPAEISPVGFSFTSILIIFEPSLSPSKTVV